MHEPRPRKPAPRRLAAVALTAAAVLAACGGGATPSPSPTPQPTQPPSPSTTGFVIHASWTQALPPRAMFGNLPQLVVTDDGRVITQGAVIEIYPGPIAAPLFQRPITPAGVAALLKQAKDLGILRQDGDFTGGGLAPGAAAGRLRIVVDGTTYDLVGDTMAAVPCPPTESCPAPVPGTPAAFSTFWTRLLDMAGWLEAELGPEQPYSPAAYAIIVGPPPEPWQGATPVVWPVAEPTIDTFGKPVRGESGSRCGIAEGNLAAALAPLFAQATVLTPFVATPTASATHSLTVRPLLPGDEDPCLGIVE